MCGITGYVDFNKNSGNKVLLGMIKALKHRGPDNIGHDLFFTNHAEVGLAHARLSIIDLSQSGHQPMHYKNLSIVYNGEIYNFLELKKNLETLGHIFKSKSDTEVILHSYIEWGDHCVDKFIGMFVIVIFDHNKDELMIIRDRAGIKPIFFYWNNGLFLFASEIKSFYEHPAFIKGLDNQSVVLYFNYGYIPAPHCIFKNCYKLLPGHFLKFQLSAKSFLCEEYWNVDNYYRANISLISYPEAIEQVKNLVKSACEYRMISDVPIGIFLSGGYDSSLVAAILQSNSIKKIKTFTIGFEEGNNEAPFARQVAEFLGTEHTEHICTYKEAQNIIPLLPQIYDEPFADSSAIPTILVSRLAKNEVSVALSADGGDEVFAGYDRYKSLGKKIKALNEIPVFFHNPIKKILKFCNAIIPATLPEYKHRFRGVYNALNKNSIQQSAILFHKMNSMPFEYLNNIFRKKIFINEIMPPYYFGFRNEIDVALAYDYKMYLQNDILQKVDRATMSVSLEGREPLLDHRLIQFVATLPIDYKYSQIMGGKRIIKDIVHSLLPERLMKRPKAGFSVPIYSWLRGDLSYLLEEYLSYKSLKQTELFDASFVIKQKNMFMKDKLYYKSILWKMLMFQMWYNKWME